MITWEKSHLIFKIQILGMDKTIIYNLNRLDIEIPVGLLSPSLAVG